MITLAWKNSKTVASTLLPLRNTAIFILSQAQQHPQEFQEKAMKGETLLPTVPFSMLSDWLILASSEVYRITHTHLFSQDNQQRMFGIHPIEGQAYTIDALQKDIHEAYKLAMLVMTYSPDLEIPESPTTTSLAKKEVTTRTNKRNVHKELDVNGVKAIELTMKKRANLQDPFLDLEVKVNNPIGRLWLAIQRLWKNQKLVIAVKFTIPLLILPIVLFIAWKLWQGRLIQSPIAKVGLLYTIRIHESDQHILLLPSDDVYLLSFQDSLTTSPSSSTPVFVSGIYDTTINTIHVETLVPLHTLSGVTNTDNSIELSPMTQLETLFHFLSQFY